MVDVAEKAAKTLANEHGAEAEVIDPRTLRPLDLDTILDSVRKTNRCVIVEEGWPHGGVGANIAALIQEQAFDHLDAPIQRVTGADVPMPYAKRMEQAAIPHPEHVVSAALATLEGALYLVAQDIVMPRLSDSMEEGTILRWLKSPGDEVSLGEELVEIETDKANMVYEAPAGGTLIETLAAGGRHAADRRGDRAGRRGRGEAVRGRSAERRSANRTRPRSARRPTAAPSGDGGRRPRCPARRPERGREGQGLSAGTPHREREGARPGGALRLGAGRPDRQGGRRAGGGGRARAGGGSGRARAPAPATSAMPAEPTPGARERPETAKGAATHEDLTKLQQTVARRMAESKATAPHFYLSAEVDMSRAVEARASIKAAAAEGEVVPSFNDMVVKACAIALREHPRANGAYRDGRLELYSRVNVGVAVAARDALVVPTVFDADQKGLRQIASETRALAQRVRDGSVTPPELSGGTFTVSNLGMFGIDSFAAVINPPQAGILAVGQITERPVVREGEITTAHLMALNLACDHRILYGADGAQFLDRIRGLLEEPLGLAL